MALVATAKHFTTTMGRSSRPTLNCPATAQLYKTAGYSSSKQCLTRQCLPAANTTNVRPRLGKQDKINYEGSLHRLEGVVHNDHLFDVYMGECIAPYAVLAPLKAVLPVHRPTMKIPLNHDDCEGNKHDGCRLEISALHTTMQRRWNNAAEMYRETHKNQVIKDLFSSLNYLRKLTSQLGVSTGINSWRRDNPHRLRQKWRTHCGNHQR